MTPLLFEETSSSLYVSNDSKIAFNYEYEDDTLARIYFVYNRATNERLIETKERIIADAFIRGWDHGSGRP